MREAQADGQEVKFFTVGKKAQSTIRFRGLPLAEAWTGFSDKPDYGAAQAIAHKIADAYIGEEVDRVVLVYNEYVSALVQRVSVTDLLPIPLEVARRGSRTRRPRSSRIRPTSSSSRSRGTFSSGCSPSTSRRSSIGRCSSRRRRSSAPR